jgi:putative SOS response-associated peptidase YedK
MCYFNGRKVSYAELVRLRNLEKQIKSLREGKLVHKGFDYENWPTIKPVGKFDFEHVEMEWGFIPDSWRGKKIDTREKVKQFRNGYKDASGKWIPGITTLNAMGEELLLPGKIFREAALNGRVLVLSWGFYESRHIPEMGKRGSILKSPYTIPHYIGLKGIETAFPMAGIFKEWKDIETGELKETFAIVTTAAPEGHIMANIHNSKKRMPTIFTWEQAEAWLYDDLSEAEITTLATTVFPSELMTAHTVKKEYVTSENPMEPCDYDEQFISTGKAKDLFS